MFWHSFNTTVTLYKNISIPTMSESAKAKTIICFVVLLVQQVFSSQTNSRRVTKSIIIATTSGAVKGDIFTTPNGDNVNAFYGIPYAKPPIGDLRFRRPIPVERWQNVFNADTKPNSCWQPTGNHLYNFNGATIWNGNTKMSEDCLKLNIWIPRPRPSSAAVMVWIHGGGFYSGTSTSDVYNGEKLASEGGVIVVSINYRLGPLGFLYLDDEEVPGNAGIYDQIMALQWINDNIQKFGGDPNRVTLFGNDAGAVSINLHQFSPSSRHLFNNIILQSGSALSPWGTLSPDELKSNSYELAHKLNCSHHHELIRCLRAKRPELFVNILSDFPVNELLKFPFVPTVNETLLTKLGDFKNRSILAGCNIDEGNYFNLNGFSDIYQKVENFSISERDFRKLLRRIRPKFVKRARYRFMLWEYSVDSPNYDYVFLLNKISGDKYFICPMVEMMQLYSKNEFPNLYMYQFEHRSSNNIRPNWMGVTHRDEIPYVFGEPLKVGKGYDEKEKQLSRDMIRYWTNFAKTGNPNSPEESHSVWPLYNYVQYNEGDYLVLDSRINHTIKSQLREMPCLFWRLRLFFDRK